MGFGPEDTAIEAQKQQFEAMTAARASEFDAMTEAQTTALEHRKKQYIQKLIKEAEDDRTTNQIHLKTFERIKGRRNHHNNLNTSTKTVMVEAEKAISKTVKNNNQGAEIVLENARAHAEQITTAAKQEYQARHASLDGKHQELAGVVRENKAATDDKIVVAQDQAKEDTVAAKEALERKLRTKSAKINERLSNHDTKHEIAKKYILYHDRAPDGWNDALTGHYGEWTDLPAEEPEAGDDGEQSRNGDEASRSRRRLTSMTPSEQVLYRRRLIARPKSHNVVLEALLKEINRLN